MAVPIGDGLPAVDDLWTEIRGYLDVLVGRLPSPIQSPYLSMQEVATGYYGRAREIEMLIARAERKGLVKAKDPYYSFRRNELAAFIRLAGRCCDLGSRRLTEEIELNEQRRSL
jgi:hypothetical protein